MMRVWMVGLWLATVVPLAALILWMRPALAASWRHSSLAVRLGLLGLWMGGAGFLLLRPHDDSFTGLDDMTYRQMAHAFQEGRGFHDPDRVLAEVPPALRESFLYHRGPVGRPTRDRVFSLSGWQSVETQPFFMPTLPLAATAQAPLLAPERFVPLVGAMWLAMTLIAGFCAGGGGGLVATAALMLGTAWPAYFLRGFYAEGVGGILIGSVVAVSAIRPLRGGMAVVGGFALGLAISYHATMVVLSVPLALALMLKRRDWNTLVGLAIGLAAGSYPFWALTRWVCQPYGDWTRWRDLKRLIFLAPEHQAIALVVVVLAVVSAGALWAGWHPAVRSYVRRLDDRATPWVWLIICLLPLGGVLLFPNLANGVLRQGAVATWCGIRWPFALWVLIAAGPVLTHRRPFRERFWLAMLCWTALLFLFIKGLETPVGLWSQRRFLPIILVGISLLSVPLAAFISRLPKPGWKVLALALALWAGGANLLRWPAPYFIRNDRGAEAWTRDIATQIGTNRWVVFDYYPHSVPYAAGLRHRVLGLGEPSREYWPEVAAWLATKARTEEVWVATSWSPCALEENARLEMVLATTGRFPTVRTRDFFPAERGERVVRNTFMRWLPLESGETAHQDKKLDGSPLGLRGPWGQRRRGATWTRQGSGLIGPMPSAGDAVALHLDCAWFPPDPDWPVQELRITPPWGGEPLRLEVPAGEHSLTGLLVRPAEDITRPPTGIYEFRVERPFDPATYGLRGYSSDLGVQLRRAIIRIEPVPLSVSE